MKLFLFFINSIYWLWAFSVPVLVCGIPAWLLYQRSSSNLVYAILLLVIGIGLGVCMAERIRKTPGLSKFFSSLSETHDMEGKNK
ncbi:MAG TPA: hypothetical protein VF476_17760 [Chitinophagaceae bacterium]